MNRPVGFRFLNAEWFGTILPCLRFYRAIARESTGLDGIISQNITENFHLYLVRPMRYWIIIPIALVAIGIDSIAAATVTKSPSPI